MGVQALLKAHNKKSYEVDSGPVKRQIKGALVSACKMKSNLSQLYLDVLPKATSRALKKCSEMTFFLGGGWYLAGGTALALQSGHRRSVDLDFFAKEITIIADKIIR